MTDGPATTYATMVAAGTSTRIGRTTAGVFSLTTSRVMLLGEDNPQSAAARYALYNYPPGCAGNRLQAILGLRPTTYLSLWRTNLCCPRWSLPAARLRAEALITHDAPWHLVIALGRKVANAIRNVTQVEVEPFGVWTSTIAGHQIRVVSLPHPSGRNQVWNDPATAVRARALLAELAPDVTWGETL